MLKRFLKYIGRQVRKLFNWICRKPSNAEDIKVSVCTPFKPPLLDSPYKSIVLPTFLPANTYIKRELIFQVIKLFQQDKAIRDSRFGTIERIIDLYYRGWFGGNLKTSAKLVFDIDRAFRYVQQHIPELRGENWLLRQRMGGEVTDEDFIKSAGDVKAIKDISKQMKLDFE